MKKFIEHIAEILEIEESEITNSFEFKNVENWDSLAQLSLLTMADDEYGVILTDEKLKSVNTIEELFSALQSS
jgi:acyl carrier protein